MADDAGSITVDTGQLREHGDDVRTASANVDGARRRAVRDLAADAYGQREGPALAAPMARVRMAIREVLAASRDRLGETAHLLNLVADSVDRVERDAVTAISDTEGSPS